MIWKGEISLLDIGAANLMEAAADLGASKASLKERHLEWVHTAGTLCHERCAGDGTESATGLCVAEDELIARKHAGSHFNFILKTIHL